MLDETGTTSNMTLFKFLFSGPTLDQATVLLKSPFSRGCAFQHVSCPGRYRYYITNEIFWFVNNVN